MSAVGFHIPVRYEGEGVFLASANLRKRLDDTLVIGEYYDIQTVEEPRTAKSHRHYFACLREVWMNLPETMMAQFPTADDLRQHALIKAGYYTVATATCQSAAEARRTAAFAAVLARKYVIINVERTLVHVFEAKSQKVHLMGKKEFQESKDKVLHVVAGMIGVEVEALQKRAAADDPVHA